MMKAIKNFMNKPITYGACFKYCAACASIGLACCGWAYYQMSKLNNWVDTKDEERAIWKRTKSERSRPLIFLSNRENSCPLWRR